ncbi:MAG: hypothetical protein ACRD9W_10795 [Terriglobia bacterium]
MTVCSVFVVELEGESGTGEQRLQGGSARDPGSACTSIDIPLHDLHATFFQERT